MTVNGKATWSRLTRLLCCAVISAAFLATILAGIHLNDTTYTAMSDKLSHIVIPLYSAVIGNESKPRRRNASGVVGGVTEYKEDDTMQVQRRVAVGQTVQSGHFILKSECEEKMKLISSTKPNNNNNQNSSSTVIDNVESTRLYNYKDRINAVIFAAMRTGSSFIGELLARRSDVFYLFEPGLRVQNILKIKHMSDVILTTKYLELLDGVYRCNFTNLDYFLRYSSSLSYEAQQKHIPGLMDPNTCNYYRKDRNNKTRRYCSVITRAAAEKKCLAKNAIGVKMIRIHDMNLLLPLVLDKEVGLQVIHLVRDPRGMVASRLMLYYNKRKSNFPSVYYGNPMREITEEYCLTWWKSLEIGRYVKELRDNYLLIRYEDAAVDPFETTRKIYGFLGLEEGGKIPKTVAKWLLDNTHKTNPKSSPYSTQRDSKSTSDQWRSKLTFEMIKKIENTGKCRDMMKAAGYQSIYDGRNLKNKNVSYVVKLPEYNSIKYDEYFPFS